MNVRLLRPLDVISGRLQDVRSGRPRDGQLGSSMGCPWDIHGTLEGEVLRTSWEPVFAGRVALQYFLSLTYLSSIFYLQI